MDRATFRIHSKDLTVAEITSLLAVKPHKVIHKGDPLSVRNPGRGTHENSIWLWEEKSIISGQNEDQLLSIARFVEQKKDALLSLASTCSFDVLCTVDIDESQHSYTIESATLASFATIKADLLFTALC
jgi:Domain of unknown function (DUF4279)